MKSTSTKPTNTMPWSPFVGCKFDCVYCTASYKSLKKRYDHGCQQCHNYVPHTHPERLVKKKVPSDKVIFVASSGDISFCPPVFVDQIVNVMRNDKRKNRVFLLQSKNPVCFSPILAKLPSNVVLMTTIETNRDALYQQYKVSSAPAPSQRFHDFLTLAWPRKALVMEPILEFDLQLILDWAKQLNPEAIFIGFESKRKCTLPEPTASEVDDLHRELQKLGFRTYDKATFKYRDVF